MTLKVTVKSMHTLLSALKRDLEKAEKGNKAASQRVRTGTIKLGKLSKKYRKESVSAEKKGLVKKPKKSVKRKGSKRKVSKKVCRKPCRKVAKKKRAVRRKRR